MGEPLSVFSVVAPGIRGLNRQESESVLDASWAIEALNAVIDKQGRLAARKGWVAVSGAIGGSPDVTQVFEYIDASNTSRMISATATNLYEGTATLTARTGALVPTAGNWQFQNFNDYVVGWQAGHAPIQKQGAGDFQAIVAGSGSLPLGNAVLAAYGRIWASEANGLGIKWSDLLNHTAWSGGSSGQLNLREVWVYGMDFVQAITAFNGFLIIFGRDNIAIYSGVDDPSQMALVEVINGVGCVARDSVQITGDDVWFLSKKGVQSLRRVIQEDAMPMIDVSKNVRDLVVEYYSNESVANIRSVYSPIDGFYLLTFPATDRTLCLDTRGRLEDGSARATYWTMVPTGMFLGQDKILYLGVPGYLAKYSGYTENSATYQFVYSSPWVDWVDERTGIPMLKIPKTFVVMAQATAVDDLEISWFFDFSDDEYTYTLDLTSSGTYEYGIGEYGIAEYGGTPSLHLKYIPAAGQGRIIRIEIEAEVPGAGFALQRIDIQAKHGRIA